MKQIIEIEVPEGKKAVLKNTTIIFEDVCSSVEIIQTIIIGKEK